MLDPNTPATPKPYRKLTEAEWAEAKALYETGRCTKTDLCEKYGISRQAMTKGLNDRGAVYGCRSKEIEEAAAEAQKDLTQKRVEDIAAMKEKQRARVELLQGLAIKQITDQVKTSQPLSDRKADMTVLRMAMAIVATGRDELYHIFDLHRDPAGADQVQEFIVGEYTQDEIEALNRTRMGISPDHDLDEVSAELDDPDADPLEGLLNL